jgi:hypothetical protein
MTRADEITDFRDDRDRLRPDPQQRFMGWAHALARGVALGGQQPFADEGLHQRPAFGAADLEAGAIERADHGRRLPGQRISRDVEHEARDQLRQLPPRRRVEPRQRLVGGLRHGFAEPLIIVEPEHPVASRGLG